jgi:hypothetical protein
MDKHRDQKGVWTGRYSGLWIMSLMRGSDGNAPTKGDKGCFSKRKKVAKGDNKKLCKMLEKRVLYNYQKNKK